MNPNQESWLSRHGTTLIAFGAALVLGIVALVLWKPGWGPSRPAAITENPSNPGWKIRYDATLALARRGSPNTNFDILEEMLDEEKQRANFSIEREDKKVDIDEQGVGTTLVATLDAIQEYHQKTQDSKTNVLKPAIEKLTGNTNAAVREKAKDVLQKLT